LAAELTRQADLTEPLSQEAFAPLTTALGVTLEEVATEAGVDLAVATRADETRLAVGAATLMAR
jgi:hypothetical protein